jgi:phage terminase large subunit GpA-like protein/intein/homing endonuclease
LTAAETVKLVSRYASEEVLSRALDHAIAEAMRPPPKLSVSEWADEHAYLSRETSSNAGRFTAFAYQREIMDSCATPGIEQVVVMKSARVGYALALDTPIPTPDGWTTMGALAVGDSVFAADGRPCRVTFTSPVFEDHDCYRLTFDDGSEIVADAGHRWAVTSLALPSTLSPIGITKTTGRPRGSKNTHRRGTGIRKRQHDHKCVVDTQTIAACLHFSATKRTTFAVDNAKPLLLPEAPLPIPPYVLGVWLGDGSRASADLTCGVDDLDGMIANLNADGIETRAVQDKRHHRVYRIYMRIGQRWNTEGFIPRLRDLGLLRNKHIPSMYFRSSTSQRLALLQGLMDTDGHIQNDGGVAEFTNGNEQLARGVFELAASLGYKPTITARAPVGRIEWKNGYVSHGHLPLYRVRFRPQRDANPFRMLRKASLVSSSPKGEMLARRRIVGAERIDSVSVRCIEVDASSHLFLAGEQMVPTHNTRCLDNVVGYYIDQDPSPILLVQPRVEDAEDYSRTEIAPMLRDTPRLREIMGGEQKAKDPDQRILKRTFHNGASISFVGANSPGGFRRITARVIGFDEVDGYPEGAGDEGDQIKLGIKRGESFWNRISIIGSTPTKKGSSRIAVAYEASDQRRYYVPCPHCNHMQTLKWANLRWDRDTEGNHMPETAHFVCEGSGCIIEEHSKPWMVECGEWRASKPFNGIAGFAIWSAYSLFPNAAWARLAKEFLEVRHNPLLLRTFVNTTLGEVWEDKAETVDASTLTTRGENYGPQSLPHGVMLLTAGVDVQGDRLEVTVLAFGVREECWAVEHDVLFGDPAQQAVWSELDQYLMRKYSREDGQELRIRAACIDIGGHHTNEVLAFCKRRRARRIFAVKGLAGPRPIWPKRFTRMSSNVGTGNEVFFGIGVDTAKDTIYGRLRIQKHGAGYTHFPVGLGFDAGYFGQLTCERVITKYKEGRGYRVWSKPEGARNEALDCYVYALAARMSLPYRLDGREVMAPPPPPPDPDTVEIMEERQEPEPDPPTPSPPQPSTRPVRHSSFVGPRAGGWFNRRR